MPPPRKETAHTKEESKAVSQPRQKAAYRPPTQTEQGKGRPVSEACQKSVSGEDAKKMASWQSREAVQGTRVSEQIAMHQLDDKATVGDG